MDLTTGWTSNACTPRLRALALAIFLLLTGATLLSAAPADAATARMSVLQIKRHIRLTCHTTNTAHCRRHRRELGARTARRRTRPAVFQAGINGGSDPLYDLPDVARLGAKTARLEFAVTASVDTIRPVIAGYAQRGVRVILLAGFDQGHLPTTAAAQNTANWAREFGPGGTFWANRSDPQLAVQDIEFGNETSYRYQGTQDQGATYALRFKDAHTAIQNANPNVGLLAQADDQTGSWIDDMFAAVPDLGSRVAGWTIHPYGTDWATTRINRLLTRTAAHGASSTIPIDVTEWGLSTDNGACLDDNYGYDKCMTYATAASTLTTTLQTLRTQLNGRLRNFIVYRVSDLAAPHADTNREHYFGALHQDGSDKGPYTTTIHNLLTS